MADTRALFDRSDGSLGIIVLSYGHGGEAQDLVARLTADGLDAPRIVVVHNPIDATDRWVPERIHGVNLLVLPENRGYAGGMNAGARFHLDRGTAWLLLLTHDARPEPGSLATLLTAGLEHPRMGVLGPLLALEDGELWSAGVVGRGGVIRHLTDWSGSTQANDTVIRRDSLDGTILLVRAEAYSQVGGFDESFFMYWEETEFCLRCRREGWDVGLVPDARAVTSPGRARRPAVHAYLQTRNGLEYARRLGGRRAVLGQLQDAARRCVWDLPHPMRSQWRDRMAWSVTYDRWFGTAVGTLDFMRGRWGPPPPIVRRRSDLR